jgi:hypothetical protein
MSPHKTPFFDDLKEFVNATESIECAQARKRKKNEFKTSVEDA